jgi:capsular polysaccharide transport system permease protein
MDQDSETVAELDRRRERNDRASDSDARNVVDLATHIPPGSDASLPKMPTGRFRQLGAVDAPARRLEMIASRAEARLPRSYVEAPLSETEDLSSGDDDEEVEPARPVVFARPLPIRHRRPWVGIVSFLLIVALPVAVVSYYYLVVAAPQYASGFHFSVRSEAAAMPQPAATTASGSGALASSFSSGSFGTYPAGADVLSNFIVTDYLTSRQSLDDVAKVMPVYSYFESPRADWWARLSPNASQAAILRYWQHMVFATYDAATGVGSVEVRAFTPEAAHAIAAALAANAEKLVNSMEVRAREDAVRYASQMVAQDEKSVKEISLKLWRMRRQHGVIDPNSSIVTDNVDILRGLRTALAQLETQYATLLLQAPRSPTTAAVREQIKATKQVLTDQEANISETKKGAVLPTMVGAFEAENLEQTIAQQLLSNDMSILQMTKASAITQSLYIMEHVQPQVPLTPDYPRRWLYTLLFAIGAVGAWIMFSVLRHTVKSHLA